MPDIILTTASSIEGRPATATLGIVGGEAVAGTNFLKDFFAGFTDVLGGRSRGYEATLQRVRDQALEDMSASAARLGADAVIAIDLDYQTIASDSRTMLLCVASGTAVKLAR